MKNYENQTLLANKRKFDEARKARVIAERKAANLAAMRKVGGQK